MDKELRKSICKWVRSLDYNDEYIGFHKWNRAIKLHLTSKVSLGITTWPSLLGPCIPWTPQAFCQDSVERIIKRWFAKDGIGVALADDDVFEMTKEYCENLEVEFDPAKFEPLDGRNTQPQ